MDNPLAGLVSDVPAGNTWKLYDGSVTSVGPLTVTLDHDTEAVEPTKVPLVAGLANGQRVLCLLADRQLIILGRYGG